MLSRSFGSANLSRRATLWVSDKQRPRLLDAGKEALVTGIAHFYNRLKPPQTGRQFASIHHQNNVDGKIELR